MGYIKASRTNSFADSAFLKWSKIFMNCHQDACLIVSSLHWFVSTNKPKKCCECERVADPLIYDTWYVQLETFSFWKLYNKTNLPFKKTNTKTHTFTRTVSHFNVAANPMPTKLFDVLIKPFKNKIIQLMNIQPRKRQAVSQILVKCAYCLVMIALLNSKSNQRLEWDYEVIKVSHAKHTSYHNKTNDTSLIQCCVIV